MALLLIACPAASEQVQGTRLDSTRLVLYGHAGLALVLGMRPTTGEAPLPWQSKQSRSLPITALLSASRAPTKRVSGRSWPCRCRIGGHEGEQMSSAVDGATPLFTVQTDIDIDGSPGPGSCEMRGLGTDCWQDWRQRRRLERVEVSDCSRAS